jgi:hypothetical protein
LPQSLYVQTSSSSPLKMGNTPISGAGTLTLDFEVTAGSLLASDSSLVDSHADARRVTLQGTAEVLNAYLAAGHVRYIGAGETLKVSVGTADGQRTAKAQLNIAPATLSEAALVTPLQMRLPQSLAVTNGPSPQPLVLAAANRAATPSA